MGVGQKKEAPIRNEITPEKYSELEPIKTIMMSLLPTRDTTKKIEKNQIKCKYYDKGYCKKRDKCFFYHPKTECIGQCNDKNTCPHRHRNKCRYGKECYHFKNNVCEFKHEEIELVDVTLASENKQQNKTHNVILAAPSTLENEVKCLEKQLIEYKIEIEKIMKEVKEEKEKQIEKEKEYK